MEATDPIRRKSGSLAGEGVETILDNVHLPDHQVHTLRALELPVISSRDKRFKGEDLHLIGPSDVTV